MLGAHILTKMCIPPSETFLEPNNCGRWLRQRDGPAVDEGTLERTCLVPPFCSRW